MGVAIRSRSILNYLTVLIVLCMISMVGCSGGGGGVESRTIVPFKRQQFNRQAAIKDSSLVVLMNTKSGPVNISPGMVPVNADYVNKDYYDKNYFAYKFDIDFSKKFMDKVFTVSDSTRDFDPFSSPWVLFQTLHYNSQDDDVRFANMHWEDRISMYGYPQLVRQPGICGYQPWDSHPGNEYDANIVWHHQPVLLIQDSYDEVVMTGGTNSFTYTQRYLYHSYETAPGMWYHDFTAYDQNGVKVWEYTMMPGQMEYLNVISGIGDSYVNYGNKRIEKNGAIYTTPEGVECDFQWQFSKLAFQNQLDTVSGMYGDDFSFENWILWQPESRIPTQEEDCQWKIELFDPDSAQPDVPIAVHEGTGNYIYWNFDSLDLLEDEQISRKITRKPSDNEEIIFLPKGTTKKFAGNHKGYDEDGIFTLEYKITASAKTYKAEDIEPPLPEDQRYWLVSSENIEMSPSLEVLKVYIDGDIVLRDDDNNAILAEEVGTHYDKTGEELRSVPAIITYSNYLNHENKGLATFELPDPDQGETVEFVIYGKIWMLDDGEKFEYPFFPATNVSFSDSQSVVEVDYSDEGSGSQLLSPGFVAKFQGINWYARELEDGELGEVMFLGSTDFSIYSVYDSPIGCQESPRVQILEIACSGVQGLSEQEELKNNLVEGVWKWLHGNPEAPDNEFNISYYGPISNVTDIYRCPAWEGNLWFSFYEMVQSKQGNCQSSAALYQACCNAIGLPMEVKGFRFMNYVNDELVVVQISFKKMKVFSSDKFEKWAFGTHMIGYDSDSGKTYDPIGKYEDIPVFIFNIDYYNNNGDDYPAKTLLDVNDRRFIIDYGAAKVIILD